MKAIGKVVALGSLLVSPVTVTAAELGEYAGVNLSLGGYVKAQVEFNNPDTEPDTIYRTARQSRLNFSASKVVAGHTVRYFVEGDFWEKYYTTREYKWRLRHSYLKVNNLTLGKTWNGQFWATAPMDAEILNFWGTGSGTIAGNGAYVRRDEVLHYERDGFRFSAQEAIYHGADYPDLILSYTRRYPSGSAGTVALTARDVENNGGSDTGLGLSAAGKWAVADSTVHLSGYVGQGLGVYSGVGVGGAWRGNDEATDAENGKLVTQRGFSAALSHRFTPKLRGTLRYGQVDVNDDASSGLQATTANLIYAPLPRLELGIEWRDQSIDTLNFGPFPNVRPAGEQIEVMAVYKF